LNSARNLSCRLDRFKSTNRVWLSEVFFARDGKNVDAMVLLSGRRGRFGRLEN
jgi:hypothetical protein